MSCHTLFQKKKSLPDNLSEYKSGSFYGIVNLHQKNQSYRFNADIFISEKGLWRMDLSVSPGLPVFTLLYRAGQEFAPSERLPLKKRSLQKPQNLVPAKMGNSLPRKRGSNKINNIFDTKEVIIFFLRKKEFYKGLGDEALPPPLSKMPGWDIFKELIFERPIKKDNWTCQTNEKNQIENCRNPLWAVQWERKKKRFISIGNKEFTFTFQYLSFSPKVDEKIFNIPIPKNFKPISLGK
ncbi:MAG: hypothetical protein OXM55_00015 [Bdellovibrionales bacterium]|nr:hypothetical protein [Bdellovibrionales bacterium]